MSFAITPMGDCPYCGVSYRIDSPEYTLSVKNLFSRAYSIEQSSCEGCVGRVCDAVKSHFSSRPSRGLGDEVSLEDLVAPWGMRCLNRNLLDFDEPPQPNVYEAFSDSQLAALVMIPDQSETEVYKAIVNEIIRREVSLDPNALAIALDRALPVPVDGDISRVFIDNFGRKTSIVHGNIEQLRVITEAICKSKVCLLPECWINALWRAGPHCIGDFSNRFFPNQRIYSEGDFEMMKLLLDAIRATRVILPLDGVNWVLRSTRDKMHREVLRTFLAISPNEEITEFFIRLFHDTNFDPCLIFFAEGLGELLREKTSGDLEAIFSSFFTRCGISSSRTVAIVETMLKNGVDRAVLDKLAQHNLLLSHTLSKISSKT